ncbi:MAG: serine hydrolase [Verrucomicrobia bacterium]|nr:serine hydrolase [Verrucomicrobiota bacterium]
MLKKETIELLWTSQKTTSGEETGYGIGWKQGTDESGRSWIGHGGGSVGGTTVFRVYPEEGVVIALISNRSGEPFDDVPGKIAGLFFDQEVEVWR